LSESHKVIFWNKYKVKRIRAEKILYYYKNQIDMKNTCAVFQYVFANLRAAPIGF